jgi:hypothetical protein
VSIDSSPCFALSLKPENINLFIKKGFIQMKNILIALLTLCVAGLAQARHVRAFHTDKNTVVYGGVFFSGYGEVASSRVCLSGDGQTLQVDVGAYDERVCESSHYDRSDSVHPVKVCDSYKVTHHEAQTLTTDVSVTNDGCVKGHIDRSDSVHPIKVCDERGQVTYVQDLDYIVYQYSSWDYRHNSTPIVTSHRIQSCLQ